MTAACGGMWDTAPKGCWAGGGGGGGVGASVGVQDTSAAAEMVSAQLLKPLHRSLVALDPRTAASVAPTAAVAAVQGLLTRVRSEGKGGIKAGKGGAARLAADVEALIAAADIDSLAAAAEAAGVVVMSRPNTPAKHPRPRSAGVGGAWGGGSAASAAGGGSSDWTDDATAGAGATALSAWRSVARRARAVVRLAVAAGGGGDLVGAAVAGMGLADVDEWRRVCVA